MLDPNSKTKGAKKPTSPHRPQHFLDIADLPASDLRHILDMAHQLKGAKNQSPHENKPIKVATAEGAILAMIFDKPSTRTRVSFDVAIRQLGGESIVLNSDDMQLGRGETIADTARVLSRYVDAIMIRTGAHSKLLELSKHASVPVINGLTDDSHPCQILADVLTFEEHKGPVEGRIFAWIGDGNNVAVSMIHAATLFGFKLRLACPKTLEPPKDTLAWAKKRGGDIELSNDPDAAAKNADCVFTDTWVSMGDKNAKERITLLSPFQVNARLMKKAAKEALFMHCLPAHRGEEVTEDVLDGPQSVVFDEAENRLHAQKAILAWCLKLASEADA